MSTIEELATVLQNIPAGLIPTAMRADVLNLLSGCWEQFDGSTDSNMAHWKVIREGGATDMAWDPPVLSFVVERHGATVLGSTRAEKQRWLLNLEKKTANHWSDGYRQLYPKAPPLNVKPIAEQVFEAVRQGPKSDSELISTGILVWRDDHIIVWHGKLIPGGGYAMTVSGRRRRFRAELASLMETIGWELVSVGRELTFKRRDAP
jgi:hypothetical protein